jgi:hypothetical protein
LEPIRIFISYAHKNAIWLRETKNDRRTGAVESNTRDLLSYWRNALRRECPVEFWYDRDENAGLRGGDLWEQRILTEIDRANVAVLLITQEFVDSQFIRDRELPRIMQRAQRGELQLVPVLLEPSECEDLELGAFQLTPGRPTPLIQSHDEGEYQFKTAMLEVLKSLKAKVRRARERREEGTVAVERAFGASQLAAGGAGAGREARPVSTGQVPRSSTERSAVEGQKSATPTTPPIAAGVRQTAHLPRRLVATLHSRYESPLRHSRESP